ncbi:WXG100 family type VII secretion target [Micromonospora lupini]|uniref:WXG100 family type VII secretion target n=1 Tax=Micromonospora lupini TaxID=285679 RepID=UPI002251D1AD|nr:WXG100 family type VII secretion target [Micromonospora lupini]MCX5065611.1 WXG100 family type VII secretion target [Micromonospora lupini]
MSDVSVGYEGLQSAARSLTSGQEEMTQKLSALKAMIDQLVNSEFRTQLASGRFQDSYQQWTTGAQNMIGGLEGMSSFLVGVVREHQELDARLAGGING